MRRVPALPRLDLAWKPLRARSSSPGADQPQLASDSRRIEPPSAPARCPRRASHTTSDWTRAPTPPPPAPPLGALPYSHATLLRLRRQPAHEEPSSAAPIRRRRARFATPPHRSARAAAGSGLWEGQSGHRTTGYWLVELVLPPNWARVSGWIGRARERGGGVGRIGSWYKLLAQKIYPLTTTFQRGIGLHI